MGNRFLVSVICEMVVIFNPPRAPISKDEALNLAAWLVALADTDGKFNEILQAVTNT